MIARPVLKIENNEITSDFVRSAIDGREWINSRFHINLLSEKLIGNIIQQQSSLQEQHLQAFKNVLAKRKRRIEKKRGLRHKCNWNRQHQSIDPLNTH